MKFDAEIVVRTRRESSCKQSSSSQLYDAPTDTKRVSFGGSSGIGKQGRKLTYRAKVEGDVHLLVGMATTAMLNLKPEGEGKGRPPIVTIWKSG